MIQSPPCGAATSIRSARSSTSLHGRKAKLLHDLTFLLTDYGKSFTEAGFGGWFRERCDASGLPHCSAHGLRKAAATALAESGASAHQLMAWFGWKSLKEAERYTRAANQKKLVASVVSLLSKND